MAKWTYNDFVRRWNERQYDPYNERRGQAAFNALCEFDSGIAELVRGVPGLDPFYDDRAIPAFLMAVFEPIPY